ncbi:MAG: glutamate-1-semialdehyde 2,1-aminomutase [Firmicutes bacterium]|nr:glutamate-1-semialdehyde 2,1-aminomutase [Bacillota bacterium]
MASRSSQLFARARRVIPGGVDSPVRAFGAVGGEPLFIARGEGPHIWDVDGRRYIDYVMSWGALPLGHAPAAVVEAVAAAARAGTSFGAPVEAEAALAEAIVEALPGAEQVRFVNSGTEAAMSALRLARAYTGRPGVVKFAGCYHGHADPFLVEAGSGALTHGHPSSPGVPEEAVRHTYIAPYNDLAAVERLFEERGRSIAAVIVEPVAANMGLVPPAPGFLEGLRALTRRHGALLIFDEVITGFRLAWGGAQVRYGVQPDLTCLGKVIGGGLPVGAYAGPREIMRRLSPEGPVYQAGTLSGNPLTMAAGLATLEALRRPGAYERLEAAARRLAEGLAAAAESLPAAGLPAAAAGAAPLQVVREGTLVGLFFAPRPPAAYADVLAADRARYARFFWEMLKRGVYLPPSPFEILFVSLAHDKDVLDRTAEAARDALEALGRAEAEEEEG